MNKKKKFTQTNTIIYKLYKYYPWKICTVERLCYLKLSSVITLMALDIINADDVDNDDETKMRKKKFLFNDFIYLFVLL